MATTQDFTDTLKDMMGAWQMDQSKFEEAWKSSTGFGEKASGIALDAAGKTTDISVGWTMETLGRMGDLAKARTAPTDYAQAMNDMVEHCSTRQAPWHLIPAENKRYARIQALRIVCETLTDALKEH